MRILLIAASSPFAVGSGGGGGEQRSRLMLSALEQLGGVVVLMLYERPGEGARVTRHAPLLVEGCWPSGPLRIRRWTERRHVNRSLAGMIDFRQYDLICGRHLWPIGGLTLPADVPTIVDLDDLHYSFSSNGAVLTRAFQRTKMAMDYVLESAAMRRYSACWFVSERDRKRHPAFRSRILPNVPFAPKAAPTAQASGMVVLFVGSLWYQPNQEGVEWFLQRCWPRILQAEPGARFKIVGAAVEQDRQRWSRLPGVEVAGFVNDLGAAYEEAALTVAPIFSGGGSNIKVIESLAHRRACVTTTFASQAYQPHLRGGEHLAVVDAEDQWVNTCLSLLRDSGERAILADAGKEVADRMFSADAFRRVVQELVIDVTSHHASRSARNTRA